MFYILIHNVLYTKKEKIYPNYVLKHNSNREKLILLIVPNGEECLHIAVKKLPTYIITRNNSKHQGDFYCLNCLRSFATKKKDESHKNICQNKGFCNVLMPSEETKILEVTESLKPDKA